MDRADKDALLVVLGVVLLFSIIIPWVGVLVGVAVWLFRMIAGV